MTSSRDNENESSTGENTNNKILSWLQTQQNKLNSPREILIPSAIDAAIMTSCAGATYYFMNKENLHVYNHPFTFSTVLSILVTLLRSPKLSEEHKRKALLIACGTVFSINDILNRLVITHESGHAFACFALFKNPKPIITLNPEFGLNSAGGYTNCNSTNLSDFAIALGEAKYQVLFSSSGTLVNMLLSFIMLSVAEFLPGDYFDSKCHLRIPATATIVHAIYYALSALWLCDSFPGHDFCNIQDKGGITPIESAMIILGMSLFVQLTLSGTNYLRKCKKNPSDYQQLTNEAELPAMVELNEPEDAIVEIPNNETTIAPKMI